jgi:hypothetical protein
MSSEGTVLSIVPRYSETDEISSNEKEKTMMASM